MGIPQSMITNALTATEVAPSSQNYRINLANFRMGLYSVSAR